MKKALITGIAGFAGSHLAEFLLSQKIEVFGFYLPGHSIENVDLIKEKINLIACDLSNKKDVEDKVYKINPDYVFHLAAFASPAQSFKNPRQTLENNIVGQLNLLEALVKIKS
ncbi:MAG TPA: GDP-mannose 4,6-dehydratase, partial [Patescibacteria group bacterium]|nr:GDP-mannose 4,6-dehydratase [Patescibacteria group bacterium]